MFLTGGASGALQANWYVAGPEGGAECVVIDPGQDAAAACRAAVAESGRQVAAVLATHGHIDHVADAARLSDSWGVPLFIHSADRPFLVDPAAAVSPDLAPFVHMLFPDGIGEPSDVREYQIEGASGRGVVGIGGLEFEVSHAPGHTPGCVLLSLAAQGGRPPVVFTGDVVFAGSIGRTDFPVGDAAAMRRSLRDRVLPLPDAAVLLPGHGSATDMARERLGNPYLQPDFLADRP
ncbi:MAG: MBL fold metallo-hydrolase [Bifidobacteriaceae bacterium]|jgi:glyoxylase-like metal-dependent hydrolase (beta-lactamase superfamily II)|nr:MBL fold metallo-hydrolase [Bifidobacteriaceae bacterium]